MGARSMDGFERFNSMHLERHDYGLFFLVACRSIDGMDLLDRVGDGRMRHD
jgi:hypothetical protein